MYGQRGRRSCSGLHELEEKLVPRDGSESKTETRKGNQKVNYCGEGKASEDNRECSGNKTEEGDVSSCGIEPSTTALIPPWLRNSLGLAEKGDKKPNQKCLKVFCATNEQTPCTETCEMRADSDGDCLKCHFYIEDSPSTNPILEVNIGSEADFLQDTEAAEKLSSSWRLKPSRHNQYESNVFGTIEDREVSRSVKSEVMSIDVVVPMEDQDEEKRKLRSHKAKSRMRRRTSNGCFKSDDICRSAGGRENFEDFLLDEPVSNTKFLDARLLLLCGKKKIDNLTQEGVALLQEMKNQIGHKEGFEKLFNEIRESAFTERGATKDGKKADRKEEREHRREATKDSDRTAYLLGKSEESRTKTRAVDEERKSLDDGKKHHDKKIRNQQRKCTDEPEPEKEKKGDKWKCPGQRSRDVHSEKEKKTKLRHCDYSVIEKVVSDTLQKFIDLYRVQVPPDVISSMKKSIIQTLQNDYKETNGSRRGLDAVLAVQDQLKSAGVIKCSMHHLLKEEREDKHSLYKTGDVGLKPVDVSTNFTSEENVVSKDVPTGNEEVDIACKVRGFEERGNGKTEALRILWKDFERCLDLIQRQMDVTGTRLCSVILEKIGKEDKKLRIVHNFSNGLTESIKVYDKPNKGSPEGDNLNTAVDDCLQNFHTTSVKQNQWSQTRGKTYGKASTQTDWVDISVKHLMNPDLNPGLYRITKATESGRFYLTPEVLDDDDDDVDEDNKIKRVSSEVCMRPDVDQIKWEILKYASRETFVSERGNLVGGARTLWKTFKSDCLGLNYLNAGALNNKSKQSLGKTPRENLTDNKKAMKDEKEEEEEVEREKEMEKEVNVGKRSFMEEKDTAEDSSDPDGCHRECIWLWNGKKMSPGIDLKVHVEDLLHEKLNEMLWEGRITETESGAVANESAILSNPNISAEKEMSAKNLEIRKTRAKFCIINEDGIPLQSSPFIFSGSGLDSSNSAVGGLPDRMQEPIFGKSVREVGTQNSQHTIVSLNINKMKERSKLCTIAKFSKRKQSYKLQQATSKTVHTVHPFAESVGEAKKIKLEFREGNEIPSNSDKGSNSNTIRECFSIISNASSSSNEGPVRVKLIGIEVSKEKAPGDGDLCLGKSSETKGFAGEEPSTTRDEPRKYKHWEIIENVLNRVSQKEKDVLWNDIRDFVKKKIGRDINEEGAREVCIELEQDVPKFAKGKASHMVVARGNYTRKEGDVEVEVDLTLDDLERILRHRQKMRRRKHSHSQKAGSKMSSTSSDTVTSYHAFKCRPFADEDYLPNKEMKILKEYN